jgi:hypothetical protein
MDVSNGTGEDTQYRTGSGTTKTVEWAKWTTLPSKGTFHCGDPAASWTICFKLPDGKILVESFTEPMASVTLTKSGNNYRIACGKKVIKRPIQPSRPAKPAVSNKPTKAKSAA